MAGMRHKQRERRAAEALAATKEGASPRRPNTKSEEAAASASRLLGGDVVQDTPVREATETQKVPLGHIRLDPTNVRTRYISVAEPTLNTLSPDHPDYETNQKLIDGLVEFASQLKTNPILQLPALYMDRGNYYTAYGARRFLSLLIAYGPSVGATFKVYKQKPEKLASMRFIENAEREDLPLSGKVIEFKNAYDESVELLVGQGRKPTIEAIASEIQKSSSLVSVYRYAIETPALFDLVVSGKVTTFNELRAARKAKATSIEEILALLQHKGDASLAAKPKTKRAHGGRPLKSVSWPKVKDVSVMRRVISGELAQFDWKDEDFESLEALSQKLAACIQALKEGNDEQ